VWERHLGRRVDQAAAHAHRVAYGSLRPVRSQTFGRLNEFKAKAKGVIATQDLLDLAIALIAFLAREETADRPSIRGLYDFSEVAAIAVPQTKAAERGSLSAILRGQRVMVQSQTLACGVVETFVQSQRLAGDNHLVVVTSLDEANALLGLNAPNFEVVG